MVVLAEFKEVSFSYPMTEQAALAGVSLPITAGAFILLAGPSGSGKTTLLRHLKKELWPVGQRTGRLFYQGAAYEEIGALRSASEVGMVFQNPENQLVMDTVLGELAFTLENIGVPTATIERKIAEFVNFLGFQDLLEQSIHTLSGGQKQLVNLAAALMLQPKLLLLDEPTANLDPIATQEFLNVLKRVHEELGITIVMSEHRLAEVLPMATELVFMEQGKIIQKGEPHAVIQQLWETRQEQRLFIPQIPRLFLEVEAKKKDKASNSIKTLPFSVREGQIQFAKLMRSQSEIRKTVPLVSSNELLLAHKLTFQYEKQGAYILKELELSLMEGQWLGLIGKNGSGKSTLLMVLAGLLKRRRGTLQFYGNNLDKLDAKQHYRDIGYVSQSPAYHFAYDTVAADFKQRASQLDLAEPDKAIEELIQDLGLGHLKERNPLDCSVGEQQMLALGLALLSKPKLLLLDEPTKGLDPIRKEALGLMLQELKQQGMTIMMATHDLEFAASFATEIALLFAGKVIAKGEPQSFFSDNFFYTTAINRVVGQSLPQCLTWKEVLTYVT